MNPNKLYHCTRLEFLDEILRYGLVPIRPLDRVIGDAKYSPGEKKAAVFVSEVPFKWMHWTQVMPDGSYCAAAMLTIDAKGLERVPDPSPNHSGDWAVLEKILQSRFKRIVFSTIENPTTFNKLKLKNVSD